MKTAVVIPFFNEGCRVLESIHAAQDFQGTEEVIVVDDGSMTRSHDVLTGIDGITLLTHAHNLGKGEALNTGVMHALSLGYDAALFLDSDLVGIGSRHLRELVGPIEGESLMSIGYLGLRSRWAKGVYRDWGALCGQRALRLEVWDLLNERDKHGFNIEASLNARMRKQNKHRKITRVELEGVSHVGKRIKEDSLLNASVAYSRTYGAALLTYARIELEALTNRH